VDDAAAAILARCGQPLVTQPTEAAEGSRTVTIARGIVRLALIVRARRLLVGLAAVGQSEALAGRIQRQRAGDARSEPRLS
jgi:hypothetical protein